MAGTMGLSLPDNLNVVRVPCTGKVDTIHILRAFELGAEGVIVLACHDENCKFLTGNIRARKRVEYLKGILEEIGLEKERLEIYNLAPNMGHRFAEVASSMAENLKKLRSAEV
ncbi:MAG: hydrogenase iron-sulfur subunit [Deltaproteobacteria bacterium]|nr:MAG: hydrogenase iron-sulfur subunit [Deltaproteobacteria bacterium]